MLCISISAELRLKCLARLQIRIQKANKNISEWTEVKAQLSEFIGRVAYGRERVLILRHGKPVAALVSVEDLRWLEAADQTQVTAESQQPAVTAN